MGVVLPIVGAVAGIATTAYGIINSENKKEDDKVANERLQKTQQIENLKAERQALEIEKQTAEFNYNKILDEAIRKKKVKTIVVSGLCLVLFSVAIIITLKIKSSEETKRQIVKI
jgi:hemolysin activation/secretion protein